MGVISSNPGLPSSSSSQTLTTGRVDAPDMTASIELAFDFPPNTKAFLLRGRTPATIRVGFSAGQIALGNYLTVTPGGVYGRTNIGATNLSLYFVSATNVTLEIESWI